MQSNFAQLRNIRAIAVGNAYRVMLFTRCLYARIVGRI
jgi:hypothetical protein